MEKIKDNQQENSSYEGKSNPRPGPINTALTNIHVLLHLLLQF